MRTVTIAIAIVAAAAASLAAGVRGGGISAPLSAYDQEEAINQVWMSNVAYCDKEEILSWDCGPCKHVDPNLSGKNVRFIFDEVTGSQLYVAKTSKGFAVIGWRGSSDLQNWIDDFDFKRIKPYNETQCPGCEVHQGFYESFKVVRDRMYEAMQAVGIERSTPIVVTGHSLGAAQAAVCVFDLKSKQYQVMDSYTFGEPRVGNAAWAKRYNEYQNATNTNSFRVVHWRDPVPHLPLQEMGFHHISTEVWYNNHQSSFKVCDGSGEDPHCSDSLLLPVDANDHDVYINVTMGC